MSSLLEERYRRALRMLPAGYRQVWEEDMVATFLEAAYAADPDDPEGVELSSPSRTEWISIAALATRLRLGGVGAAPRSFAWGEAVRRLALIGLLAHATGALVSAITTFWLIQHLPGLTIPEDAGPLGYPDRWHALWDLSGLLWLPAYLSVVYGNRRAAGALALAAFIPVLISTGVVLASDGLFVLSRFYGLLFAALPVLALAAFHSTAPPVVARPWLASLPIAVALTFATLVIGQSNPGEEAPLRVLADWPGLWCCVLVGATVAHLAASAVARAGGAPWTLALALLAPAVLGLRVTSLVDHVTFAARTPQRPMLVAVGIAQSTAVLAAGLVLAILAARHLRRLPEASAATVPPGTPPSAVPPAV